MPELLASPLHIQYFIKQSELFVDGVVKIS